MVTSYLNINDIIKKQGEDKLILIGTGLRMKLDPRSDNVYMSIYVSNFLSNTNIKYD